MNLQSCNYNPAAYQITTSGKLKITAGAKQGVKRGPAQCKGEAYLPYTSIRGESWTTEHLLIVPLFGTIHCIDKTMLGRENLEKIIYVDIRKFVTCEFSGRHVWFWPFAQYFHYQLGKGQLNYFLGSESDFFTLVFDQPVILDRNMSFRSRFVFSSGSVGPSVALSSVPVQGLLHVSLAPPEPLILLFDPIQPCRPVSSSLVLSTLSASNLRWQCATIPLTSALALDPRRFPHRVQIAL